MSFYNTSQTTNLRLGDVVRGFMSVAPCVDKPNEFPNKEYSIEILHLDYSVILTPCCSIEKGEIVITPLKKIRIAFLKNPYFEEDLTRINSKMRPQQSVAPSEWEKMSEDIKRKRFGVDPEVFAFTDVFIYEKHDLLLPYELNTQTKGKIKSNYYMISFKDITKINCENIQRGGQGLETKILELSVAAREQLRNKIAYFYGRTPEEDRL